jgi:hypothetical protein
MMDVRSLKAHILLASLLILLGSTAALSQDPVVEPPAEPPSSAAPVEDPQSNATAQPQAEAASQDQSDRTKKSYLIPAFEIVGLNFALNRYDHAFLSDPQTFDVTWTSVRRNLKGPWVVDADPFKVNQFFHPYHGGMYHTTARSAGLGYWQSSIYTFLGSSLWEIAGETEPPSLNDQVASGIGGAFFGESLFRMASLMLEKSNGVPSPLRGMGATAISPMTGFNRLIFGNRFDEIFPGHEPAFFARWNLGSTVAERRVQGASGRTRRNEALLDLSFSYGLPGQPDYSYRRPFDYFSFDFGATTVNAFENIMSRGLLVGKGYGTTSAYHGVWGLYGSYDYLAPDIFRVSSTALSLGTTAQWRLAGPVTLQGTGLAGAGYGAGGSLENTTSDRDYHYGLTPQALLTFRLILGKIVSLDVTGRGYRITNVFSTSDRGWENVGRGDASLTMRLFGPHALTVKYLVTRRYASYPDLGVRDQRRDTVSVFYTFVRDRRMGAIR